MVELHFKSIDKELLDDLKYAIEAALVGSHGFEKGDEIFVTPVEKTERINEYGFIFYVGKDNEAPRLIFEDNHVIRVDGENPALETIIF